jgi:outer membrane protein assembly factor BamB
MAKIAPALLIVAIPIWATTWSTPRVARAAEDSRAYRVAQVWRIEGTGRWDYVTVDEQRKLLYLPLGKHTVVLDATNGKAVADIPGQKGSHGVALVPGAKRGFISDGSDGSVVIFDVNTNQVLGKVKAAEDADAIIYDRASDKVLVSCGDANVMIPISPDVDLTAGKADAAVSLGGKPEALVADGKGKVYINLVDKNQVAAVDSRSMKVLDKWSTAPGGRPVGLSIDGEHRRLFLGCRNPKKLLVMSADDGRVLADLPIGAGCDGTVFDGDVFASCMDGSLSVARERAPGKFELIQNLKTRPGAKTVGVDRSTHTLFLPTREDGKLILLVVQCDLALAR